MSDLYLYKGLFKVKVVTESEGYWIVEALEDFKPESMHRLQKFEVNGLKEMCKKR